MCILEVKDIYFTYPDGDYRKTILNHVSASFECGKFYTILGSSGCGKTTFLSLISALDKAESGDIYYNGININEIGFEKYRRNHVGIVFQNYNLIMYMTALENVQVAMGITENDVGKDISGTALDLLEKVGIDRIKANRRVTRLSGGEQQRVAIARALSTNADIILADEPTGNLYKETGRGIVDIFKNLAHDFNKCVIVVTHSEEVAKESDEILRLYSQTQSFNFK